MSANRQGYIAIKCKNHPNCDKQGYVMEHRIVMEKKIGRYLGKKEMVHHINGERDDNRIENLLLLNGKEEHNRIHRGWEKKDGKWFKKCGLCKNLLEVSKKNFSEHSNNVLSSWCRDCTNEYRRQYRIRNKEAIIEKERMYREKRGKIIMTEEQRARGRIHTRLYYRKNRIKILKRLKEIRDKKK